MSYTMPPEHQQRERKEITNDANIHGSEGALQQIRIEVLLDVRDLLREVVVGLSEVRGYLETIAIRAEQNLAEGFRNPKKEEPK
jgi:hypothetical protein